jgi:hypothetical protein
MTKKMGWETPNDTFPCWVVTEGEMIDAFRNNAPFPDSMPHCFFKLTQRLDNNYIQGCLRHSLERDFHTTINSSTKYFIDLQLRIPVYFTFDRVTIYRLVEILPSHPLSFIFRRIDQPQKIIRNKAFMIMPIGKDPIAEQFYLNNVKFYLKTLLGIDIYRADDFNGNDIIIDTIYKQIEESEFIIAETSEPNKNVFYEFGWAASKDKEIITIQNEKVEKHLFFDRTHIRAIFYSADRVQEFQETLKNTVIAIRQKIDSKN